MSPTSVQTSLCCAICQSDKKTNRHVSEKNRIFLVGIADRVQKHSLNAPGSEMVPLYLINSDAGKVGLQVYVLKTKKGLEILSRNQ